jgi:hypothetical protein
LVGLELAVLVVLVVEHAAAVYRDPKAADHLC